MAKKVLSSSAEKALKEYMRRGLITHVNPDTLKPIQYSELGTDEKETMSESDLEEIIDWIDEQ